MEVRDRTGIVLGTASAAVEPGETHCAHRADVHTALVAKLRPERLHLKHRVASIENGPDHAVATFENGRRICARLIVGADGLRSVVRALIDTTPMTFLKQITNRTIAPASLLPPTSLTIASASGRTACADSSRCRSGTGTKSR